MALSDAAIKICVDYLLDDIHRSGRTPRDAEGAMLHAIHTWMQNHPTSTPWLTYDVDGYRFFARRDTEGRLHIGKEL